jgi:Tol biopolymer transport system component
MIKTVVSLLCFISVLWLVASCSGPTVETSSGFPILEGPYLGQEPPGEAPVLFAPGVVSTQTGEWSTAFTPDGQELFFGLASDESTYILHTKIEDGRWTPPEIASFSGQYSDFDLTMSPDGNRLYFTSSRPTDGEGEALANPDIWYVDRSESGWGEPERFPVPINTEERELYPSESKDGFIYFFSSRPGGFGRSDLYGFAVNGEEFGAPQNLGPAINTENSESDACVSPGGDYIVFTSTRDGGFGDGDLYVSFRLDDGSWSQAQNLGETVNTEHLEFCPSVSRDGKYLFFTSNRPKPAPIAGYEGSVRDRLGVTPSTERPDIDIYWVGAGFIEAFRPGEDISGR